MPKEMRKYIDRYREFVDKSKIIEKVSELTNEEINDINKALLIYEIGEQRTYILKNENYFFIVNDNKGQVSVALKRPLAMLDFRVRKTSKYYEVWFEKTRMPLKVSRKFFSTHQELDQKLRKL